VPARPPPPPPIRPPAPRSHAPPRRRSSRPRPEPAYGVGYRPDWPSIRSVAHDETDGGRLFVVTDRPCVLLGPPLVLPLSVGGGDGPVVLDAVKILPVKFRLQMSGAVARGAPWNWGNGASSLVDPISGHGPNPAFGTCDDVPGPYAPPAPAAVVSASIDGDRLVVTLSFDRTLALLADPPEPVDDAIQFGAESPASIALAGAAALAFTLAAPLGEGSSWSINRQPDWLATPVAVPQSGSL
jgi:hypothetical protein